MEKGRKPKGRHPHNALKAVSLNTKKPGRHADGNGLYLVVDPSGAKRWILRTYIKTGEGKYRTDIGLGGVSLISLAEAREEATRLRKIARAGGNPVAERRRERTVIPTFKAAAVEVHNLHKDGWESESHAAQWINTLERFAYPVIGDLRVNQIGTPHILKILAPIWLTRAETARRVRQRIATVLAWARTAGFREGENPTVRVVEGLPKQPKKNNHHAAMPFGDVPAFVQDLSDSNFTESGRLAFEFLILTATRTSEVLKAVPSEVDLGNKVWVIPSSRMKSRREHRIPLSQRCVEILERAEKMPGTFIFPGRASQKPLSNMVFSMALRRMGIDVTPHGFRSSFKDWASELTNFPNEVSEMALAHAIGDKTEAAYRRGDLFDKRRKLMDAWALFITKSTADIIPIMAGGE